MSFWGLPSPRFNSPKLSFQLLQKTPRIWFHSWTCSLLFPLVLPTAISQQTCFVYGTPQKALDTRYSVAPACEYLSSVPFPWGLGIQTQGHMSPCVTFCFLFYFHRGRECLCVWRQYQAVTATNEMSSFFNKGKLLSLLTFREERTLIKMDSNRPKGQVLIVP